MHSHNFIDLKGQNFGRLTVQERGGKNKHGHCLWGCVCSCGNYVVVQGEHLRSGHTRSCGCLAREVSVENGKARATHGQHGTPEYVSWGTMISRCENPNAISYRYYGARGIKVCKRWRTSFQNFLADMGKRPSLAFSIHRLRNDRGYCPSNCVWATDREQNQHHRNTKLTQSKADKIRSRYVAGGITQEALAVEYGVTQPTVGRVVRGESWTNLPPKKPSASVAECGATASQLRRER